MTERLLKGNRMAVSFIDLPIDIQLTKLHPLMHYAEINIYSMKCGKELQFDLKNNEKDVKSHKKLSSFPIFVHPVCVQILGNLPECPLC